MGERARMIQFDEASYSYGAVEVISRASLELLPGSMYFLTGPSGSGKTTFLKLCYLDLLPTGGDIRFSGTATRALGRDQIAGLRQRMGVVHQDCQFLDHMSVAANVALPLVISGQDVALRRDEISDLLSWVGLADKEDALPLELSGGERQRLALARAVILSPDLIIADEPTGNIDWEMGQKVMSLMIELNKLGKTIIIATHDLNLIRSASGRTAARVLRLKGGRIEQASSHL
jgi:cell division transport system ATP-binding protein